LNDETQEPRRIERRDLLKAVTGLGMLAALPAGGLLSATAQAEVKPVSLYKRTIFVRRKFDITHDQFVDHWKNIHGTASSKIVGLLRYVLNPFDLKRNPNIPFDGAAQLWYESSEAAAAAPKDPANAATFAFTATDMLTFLTPPLFSIVTKEYVIDPLDPKRAVPKAKRIVLQKKSTAMTNEQFEDYWLNTHAATASRLPELRGQKVNLVDHTLSPNVPWDGYAEIWFDDWHAMENAYKRSSAVMMELAEQTPVFTNPDARMSGDVTEIVAKAG
jgi:uncharacterized protein (TIGR02118 family)